MDNSIPRRAMLPLNTTAELAIYNAINQVEKCGADEKLTNAVVLLSQAKELLGDYIDEQLKICKEGK